MIVYAALLAAAIAITPPKPPLVCEVIPDGHGGWDANQCAWLRYWPVHTEGQEVEGSA